MHILDTLHLDHVYLPAHRGNLDCIVSYLNLMMTGHLDNFQSNTLLPRSGTLHNLDTVALSIPIWVQSVLDTKFHLNR